MAFTILSTFSRASESFMGLRSSQPGAIKSFEIDADMSRMNEFYQRLWELNEKLDEVARAFSKTDLGGQDVDREFAPLLDELECKFSKIVEVISRKHGFPELCFWFTS